MPSRYVVIPSCLRTAHALLAAHMNRHPFGHGLHFSMLAFATAFAGIVGPACVSADGVDRLEPEQISDAESMTRRPDGRFDVVCRDGRREIVNALGISLNTVCEPPWTGALPSSTTIAAGRHHSCAIKA